MLIDSHCHLDNYDDLPSVLARAKAAGVGMVLAIGIGNGPDDMQRALEIANSVGAAKLTQIPFEKDKQESNDMQGVTALPQVFATAGIHPQEAHRADAAALAKLAALVAHPRCIAVGEIGLDYYHLDNPNVAVQQTAFVAQMKIAADTRKPITIHCRTSELATPAAKDKFEQHGNPDAAWDDLLALIAEHWTPTGLPGIMHCFSGNEAQAGASLAAGFYLSFAGNVTYAKSMTIQAVAKHVPADRYLIETDAPFLAPLPFRGQQNEPALVAHTAEFIAGLRGVTSATIAEESTRNFRALFPSTVALA